MHGGGRAPDRPPPGLPVAHAGRA